MPAGRRRAKTPAWLKSEAEKVIKLERQSHTIPKEKRAYVADIVRNLRILGRINGFCKVQLRKDNLAKIHMKAPKAFHTFDHFGAYSNVAIRAILKPAGAELKSNPELAKLKNLASYDASQNLSNAIGHMAFRLMWCGGEKNPTRLVTIIKARENFFSLSNREKRRFKQWDDALLGFLEEQFRPAGAKRIVIVGEDAPEAKKAPPIARETHYVQLPKSRNYGKDPEFEGKIPGDLRIMVGKYHSKTLN